MEPPGYIFHYTMRTDIKISYVLANIIIVVTHPTTRQNSSKNSAKYLTEIYCAGVLGALFKPKVGGPVVG